LNLLACLLSPADCSIVVGGGDGWYVLAIPEVLGVPIAELFPSCCVPRLRESRPVVHRFRSSLALAARYLIVAAALIFLPSSKSRLKLLFCKDIFGFQVDLA
jgi:hypothetical protein